MSTVNDKTLRKYSSDLMSLQHHLLKAVKKQQVSEKVKQKEAIEILHLLNLKLSELAEEFEPMVAEFGGNRKEEVKSKIANFTGVIVGLIDAARKDPVSKMLRDDYIALSMLAVGYKMLHTTALVRNEDKLAAITDKHLSVITQLIAETSKAVPMIVARELADNMETAEKVGKKAVQDTQKAWSSENIKAGPEVIEI
jgi:hypothetical protein